MRIPLQVQSVCSHNHWVRAICVSNAHLFTGSHGQIVQHDLATWKAQKTMTANCGSVYSIIVMDNLLYAATYENSIYIWDLRSYTTVRTLLGHTGAVYSLAFAPSNPTKLYSGSYDTSIRQWDLSSFTCSARLAGHSGSVEAMVLTGDGSSGQTLFSASRDSFINYWRP
jgi:WD40 repeat protein